VVICLEQGAGLHIAQLLPLPLTVSCFSKIQIGFTFLVPAYQGSPRQRAIKRVFVCVCVIYLVLEKPSAFHRLLLILLCRPDCVFLACLGLLGLWLTYVTLLFKNNS